MAKILPIRLSVLLILSIGILSACVSGGKNTVADAFIAAGCTTPECFLEICETKETSVINFWTDCDEWAFKKATEVAEKRKKDLNKI